jgi:hypothetical protein
MAKQLQLRRGTTVQNDAFTGAVGELTMDTQKKQLRVHDGSTQGGAGIIDPIVAFQKPTAANNYTWYRKYASGWVEQGGYIAQSTSTSQVNYLAVEMADPNYHINITAILSTWSGGLNSVFDRTTTSFKLWTSDDSSFNSCPVTWEVKGMAA